MKTAKNKNWLLAGIFNGLQKLSIPIFGLASTMILAKGVLTVEEMGIWSLFLVVTSFVELIRQALVKTSMIKYVNHAGPEDQKFIFSSALFLNIIVTLSIIVVLFFTAVPIAKLQGAPELESMIYIFSGGMILLIPFSHFEWIMYSKSFFKGLFWTYFFRQGISLVLMILFLIFNDKITLNHLVIFYCVGIAVGIGVSYIFVANQLEKVFKLSGVWTKKLFHFGKFVFGSGLSTLVFANAAQVMIAPMLGTTIFNALQGVSARVVNLADMPSQVLSDLLFPESAKKENAENKSLIKHFYEKTVGATLCFTIPMIVFIILFPKFIILLISGPEYLDAIPFLQLLSVTGIFLAFLKQYGVIIDSTGKPEVNFITITIIALVYVVFTYIGIKQYGFMGAAYSLIAAHIVGFIITQIILYRYFSINFLNCFIQAFLFYPELLKMLLDKTQWKTNSL
jgi:O-antigen/teichoic acid export membrane protein